MALTAMVAPDMATAATLNFNFDFSNLAGFNGEITGIVRGLNDNATGPASSVEVLSNTAGFGLGEYVGNPAQNTFTVANGRVISATFTASNQSNPSSPTTQNSLIFYFSPAPNVPDYARFGTAQIFTESGTSSQGILGADLRFIPPASPPSDPTPPVAAVPEPSEVGGSLLALTIGCGALWQMKRKRDRLQGTNV
jgi:hypothetical protein